MPQGDVHKRVQPLPKAQWRVHLPDHHQGYITPGEFECNQARLARNRTNGEGPCSRVATPEQKAQILALTRNLPRLW
jgi:hypothetical protein